MSAMKRTRNIQKISTNQLLSASVFDACLGESVTNNSDTPLSILSCHSSDLEGDLDLGIKITDLSSGSSLSWSEDYEAEVTKKVQNELEKLDRVFLGNEVNHTYDEDEIAQWKHFFPNIYILGHKTPTNSAENSEASSDDEQTAKEIIKHPVFYKGKIDRLEPTLRNYHSLPRKPKSLELDRYLRVSSIQSSDTRQRKLVKKQANDGSEFDNTLLPFIATTPVKSPRKLFGKSQKTLLLPPIENSFRSVSATPRQASTRSYIFNKNTQAKLRSDLLKLFDNIPISNR